MNPCAIYHGLAHGAEKQMGSPPVVEIIIKHIVPFNLSSHK